MIDQKQNKIEVADLMEINSGRCYAVKFLNLYFGRTGTVEFRMAAASNGPDKALAWIEFSTTYIRAAILVGNKLTQYGWNDHVLPTVAQSLRSKSGQRWLSEHDRVTGGRAGSHRS
jgi:hypothetical protein